MIAPLNEQNRAEYLRRCAAVPALGPLLAANAEAFGLGGQLVQCYLCDAGVLQLRGAGATLLGSTENGELADVLAFLGITALRTEAEVPPPPGWREAGRACVMEWQPAPDALPPLPQGIAVNEEASVSAVLDILAGEGITGLAAENLYSELCSKRSRGLACAWAAEEGNTPVACACAAAITPWEAYLSEIATLPAARGRGIGRALVAALAAQLAAQGTRRVTLLCAPHRCSFYQSFGFVQTGEFRDWTPQ